MFKIIILKRVGQLEISVSYYSSIPCTSFKIQYLLVLQQLYAKKVLHQTSPVVSTNFFLGLLYSWGHFLSSKTLKNMTSHFLSADVVVRRPKENKKSEKTKIKILLLDFFKGLTTGSRGPRKTKRRLSPTSRSHQPDPQDQ